MILVMQPFWVFILRLTLRGTLRLVPTFVRCQFKVNFIFFQGTWIWLADHDLDIPGQKQISIYSGRGILSESCGPIWMIGTGMSPILPTLQTLTFLLDSVYVYFLCNYLLTWFLMIKTTAEHHVLYQYRLVGAANHYMGLIQTETVSHISFTIRITHFDLKRLFWSQALFSTQTCASDAF